jgi:gamma-glutamyltranspeptidase/glutathione hydrolase
MSQAVTSYAVSTSHPDASRVAADVLRAGGNAVDAAVAAAWVLATCEPSGSGVGGQACLVVATPDGAVHAVDGDARAPRSAARRTISPVEQRVGARATTVPTMPAVVAEAHRRWGRLPWARVLEPATGLASQGHVVTAGESLRTRRVAPALRRDAAAATAFLVGGRVPKPGAVRRLPVLARTLDRLAREGAEDLYGGALARVFVADQEARGGLVDAGDLARAAGAVRVRPALVGRRGGLRVATLPEPGGATLLAALEILDRARALGACADDAGWLATIARATRAAHDLRDAGRLVAHGAGPGSDVARLLRDEGRRIAGTAAPWTVPTPRTPREEPGDTTHVTVVDGDGTAVSLTSSVQSLYGAKALCAGLGFVYNNYLTTCTRRPGPYRLGPCCRPRSNAAPTVVLDDAGPRLVLGSAGSRRITSSLVHVLTGVLDRGLPVQAAVDGPRSHLLASGHLWVEHPDGAPLPAGDRVLPLAAQDPSMGCVNAAARDGAQWTAAADPRRAGVALDGGGPR